MLHRYRIAATLMWNHYAHMEAYFGVPSADGVIHTLNLRMHPDHRIHVNV
jgi:fatty-acyl-CoA synthase